MYSDESPLPALFFCIADELFAKELFSWLHRIIWTWIIICILFKPPVGGLWLPSNFASVFVYRSFLLSLCSSVAFPFVVLSVGYNWDFLLFRVHPCEAGKRKVISPPLSNHRPFILSLTLHVFTCAQLFCRCSVAGDLWHLGVRACMSLSLVVFACTWMQSIISLYVVLWMLQYKTQYLQTI